MSSLSLSIKFTTKLTIEREKKTYLKENFESIIIFCQLLVKTKMYENVPSRMIIT